MALETSPQTLSGALWTLPPCAHAHTHTYTPLVHTHLLSEPALLREDTDGSRDQSQRRSTLLDNAMADIPFCLRLNEVVIHRDQGLQEGMRRLSVWLS